jgi:TonB-dependent receptor
MGFLKFFLTGVILLLLLTTATGQAGIIKGTITDSKTNETLIGATILIQGTSQGTASDFDGNFILKNINPGSYNLVVSFISYQKKMVRAEVIKGLETVINIALEPATVEIGEVKVMAQRRTGTDMAMITGLKSQSLIVSGISAQQISKSQDKDAAEVIRRIPGITITDGRFVIVRGLVERYNSVMLNGTVAPSFEADKRAFSFDAIPSGLIDNILIYKSPAPELPADFAGAAIQVLTKNSADENSLVVTYGAKYVGSTTFSNDFQTYKGSPTDWLGYDDGTRDIPNGVPSTQKFSDLYTWADMNDFTKKNVEITNISKLFSNNWETSAHKPFADQDLSLTSQFRFLVGKVSVGNITSLNYGSSNSYTVRNRLEYQGYDEKTGVVSKDFDFIDRLSKQTAKTGIIHNWNILYGKNQRIEFRNFFNNMATSTTNIRDGINYYNVETLRLYDLKFVKRMVYSGQVAGEQKLNSERTKINWVAGFARTKTNQPDNRRLTFVYDEGDERDIPGSYFLRIQNVPNPYIGGRLWLGLKENVYSFKIDAEHNFRLFGSAADWKFKAGILYENKYREFSSRLIGVVAPANPVVDFYQPIADILKPENFYFDQTFPFNHGLAYRDNTRAKDSYDASDLISAGYIALNIPVTSKIYFYGGVRVEKFKRKITNFYEPTPTPELFDIVRDTTDFFPSANLTYNINDKNLLRASYGKTVNRPEFREMSNFDYQDFDLFVIIHGNDTLKNAYIQNYDLRYEWYPTPGEIISLAGFYKHFEHPIEVFLIPAGTTYDYKPFNTESADSYGLELDVRKRLGDMDAASGLAKIMGDITAVFNASLIKSQINTRGTEFDFTRDKKRIMQGQSPYIINLGLNYQNEDNGLSANLSFNRVGKRIAYVGTPLNPHTWELPVNSLDLNIQKEFGKRLTAKIGIKDLFNKDIRFVQYEGADESLELNTLKYKPNRQFSFSISYRL